MQMLGKEIRDPFGLEGATAEGLGLLDISTELATEKTVGLRSAACEDGSRVSGYEIHHGLSVAGPDAVPHIGEGLGWRSGNVVGVYLHGILENTAYRQGFLRSLGWSGSTMDWEARIESGLDAIADLVDESGWARDIEGL
jgi:Cobyric acid synthase